MKKITLKSGTELPLINLKGKDYLQVASRLVWFREEKPFWSIRTEFIYQTPESAFVKAFISDEQDRVIATSHGEESSKDFPAGHREKAETKAIGRALALCGFGTQFEPDLDEGKRVVDSPVARTITLPGGHVSQGIHCDQPGPEDGNIDPLTYKIPFGKYAGKSLEEIDVDTLKAYIQYLEETSTKRGKDLREDAAEFIRRAETFIGCFENSQ